MASPRYGLNEVSTVCSPISNSGYVDLKDSFEDTVAGLLKRSRRDVRKALPRVRL